MKVSCLLSRETWREFWTGHRPSLDARLAWAVGGGTFLLLALTASQGFVRDEGYYFRAAAEYHAWFGELWRDLWQGDPWRAFSDATLTRAFGFNTEHPGLVKIAMGWTWALFAEGLGWTSNATGYRLASMGMVAIGCVFLYLFGAKTVSRGAGVLAVALFLACPRVFYHAHLACFDAPITAAGVAVTYAFWRAETRFKWVILTGVFFGLALATKHNAVFTAATLALAYALSRVGELRWVSGMRIAVPPIPWSFVAMLLIGPVLLYLFYPYGWHAPIERLAAYYRYHLHHEHYPVDYFGTLYTEPPFPWSFPFVMTGVTVPLLVLVPGIVGVGAWGWRAASGTWRQWRGEALDRPTHFVTWLFLLSVLVPPFIIAIPTVPIFGGTKHWMPMMPFFCLAAASTVWSALEDLRGRFPRFPRLLTGSVVAAVLATPVWETARTYPLGQTYYNELIGGHRGGAALGMPRTYWGGDGRELLPVINERAVRGATLFTDRMNLDDFRVYQRDGLLRPDIRWVGDVRHADWALVNQQREYRDNEYRIWARTGSKRPVAAVELDDVPIVTLYCLVRCGK